MTKYKCPACESLLLEQTDDKIAGVGIISCMTCGECYPYLLSDAHDKSVYQIMCEWHKEYENRQVMRDD